LLKFSVTNYSVKTILSSRYICCQALYRTKTLSHTVRPVWNDEFEFDDIAGGEYLKIKCYNADTFDDESIGSARVNLEGLLDGGSRDVWVPLEKVISGEIRLETEPIKNDDNCNMKVGSFHLNIKLDLLPAFLRGSKLENSNN
jgi:Ca2+-dependent lipid-binding protein